MKNPKTTILGIVQLIITILAAIKPDLLGIHWDNLDTQQAIIAAIGGIITGGVGLYNIFFAGDKEGGI